MYNILVCDDEKDIVSALTIYLTTSGYQVFPAYDGTEALALLEKEDIHLVLLDIMMPQLDGIASVGEARKKLLLQRFGTIKAIRAAELPQLEEVLPKPAAYAVYDHFHKEDTP